MSKLTTPHRERIARAGLAFATVAPITYAIQRVIEVARSGRHDPSLILLSSHVDFIWRILIATWWGGVCAALIDARASRSPTDPMRWARAAAALGVIVVFLSAAWP